MRNGDGVCDDCNVLWEGRRNGHKEYKLLQLGEKGYAELDRLHHSIMKRDEAIAILQRTHG